MAIKKREIYKHLQSKCEKKGRNSGNIGINLRKLTGKMKEKARNLSKLVKRETLGDNTILELITSYQDVACRLTF